MKNIFFILIFLFICACAKSHNFKAQNDSNKQSALINTQLGLGYLNENQIPRAKQKLLLALQQDPSSSEVQMAMGYFYLSMHEIKLARKYYDEALKLAPLNGEVQNNYGVFLCRTGLYQQSIQYFVQAAKNPSYLNNGSAYQNAALCAAKIPDQNLSDRYLKKARLLGV